MPDVSLDNLEHSFLLFFVICSRAHRYHETIDIDEAIVGAVIERKWEHMKAVERLSGTKITSMNEAHSRKATLLIYEFVKSISILLVWL